MNNRLRSILGMGFLCATFSCAAQPKDFAPTDELARDFQNPPVSARPWVFWYWYQGLVSRAGVTADLEAMKRAGVGGAYLMPIKDVTNSSAFAAPVRQLSPEWWAMLRHAFSEADRLGLKFAMHDCDGFATAGGPWITPELAMQRVVWSETQIEGGKKLKLQLAQPPTKENYYRDTAVLAFPTPEGEEVSTRTVVPKITTSQPGFDASFLVAPDGRQFRSDQPSWIGYEFAPPFTLRSLTVRNWEKNFNGVYQATRLKVEASADGKDFRAVASLESPRHGWQDWDADYTFSVPTTTARFFRFSHDPANSEPGAEDLDSAKWKPVLKLRGLELSSAARLPNFEGKSGAVWRKSSRASAELIPDNLCVPLNQITNLTALLGTDGALNWVAPTGHWTILRIGHTPTGHENETAGGGKGLECDKFNPVAARVQFDGWFGETIRQLGPELSARVLTVFHVDSWEAGSQNWSPVFRDEFVKRRGYDPTPYLPTFAGIPVGSADISERFLFDVRQTISDLTTENFFGTMAELAREHGCEFSAEATAPTMMGDGMRHFGLVDMPMGEFWLRSPTHDKPNDIQDAISGARVYGKNIVQAEAFTELREQWDEHPGMLKALGDHNFCLGINRFVLHVFMQNPWHDRAPGVTLGGVGTFFQRDQIWWSMAGAWLDYLSRCQFLLQQGRPVADVLYFTGEDLPARAILPERRNPVLPGGYAADSINRDALIRLAEVKDGKIILPGGANYAVLVLPKSKIMSAEVAEKIARLAKAGASIYGTAPECAPGLENNPAGDERVRQSANEVWGKGLGITNGPLEAVLQRAGVAPDLLTEPDVEWTHRATADADIYFIFNPRNETRTLEVSLRAGGRLSRSFNPVTGETVALARVAETNGRVRLFLAMPPHGSQFIVLGRYAGNLSAAGKMEERHPLNLNDLWQVTFENSSLGVPAKPVRAAGLTDWATADDAAIRHYSGVASYRNKFDWEKSRKSGRVWLDLGDVANIASVSVNGKPCGTVWTPPYRVEITDALRRETNELEIRVANTWNNRLVGDRGLPAAQRKTWTNAPDRPQNTPLLPAGLLGPVTILTE